MATGEDTLICIGCFLTTKRHVPAVTIWRGNALCVQHVTDSSFTLPSTSDEDNLRALYHRPLD